MSEDGNPFKGLRSEDLIRKIEELKKTDLDSYYNLVFESITGFPEDAIEDDSPKKNKVAALNKLIDYFEQKEEYERCHELKKLLDRINE